MEVFFVYTSINNKNLLTRVFNFFILWAFSTFADFSIETMDKYSYISSADVGYLDQLYQNYQKDPTSVDLTWQKFFEGYEFSSKRYENGHKVAAFSCHFFDTEYLHVRK